jgi:hypothetical protein
MPNTKDAHNIVLQREQDAIISKAQPEGTSHVAVKRNDLAAACAGKMEDAVENAHGRGLDPMREHRLWLLPATQSDRAPLLSVF